MENSNLLRWRRTLGYTQEEAGKKLGVSRSTIQNWEKGVTRIPKAAELACLQLARRWKQRPEFGPVALVYTDGPIWQELQDPHCIVGIQCELYPNNEAALQRACRLRHIPKIIYRFIMEEDGGVIWNGPELLRECDRRRRTKKKG
jgi:DNA-binding XRE family transcriptional regulator